MERVESNNDALNDEANNDALNDYKNSESNIEEVTIARLTDEALFELSAESLTWKSRTGFRIFLVMLVQGSIMAGYGVDWSTMGGVNNFKVSWFHIHDHNHIQTTHPT